MALPYLNCLHIRNCIYPTFETQNSRGCDMNIFFSFYIWHTTPCITFLHVIIKRTWQFLYTYLYISTVYIYLYISGASYYDWKSWWYRQIKKRRSEKAGKQIKIRAMKQGEGWQKVPTYYGHHAVSLHFA